MLNFFKHSTFLGITLIWRGLIAGKTGTLEKHAFHLCWKNEIYLYYKATPDDSFEIIVYPVTSLVLLM